MLEIKFKIRNRETVELTLKGSITDDWVSEFRRICLCIIKHGKKLIIDLSSVVFVDAQGVELLKNLLRMKVKVENVPIYVSLALKES